MPTTRQSQALVTPHIGASKPPTHIAQPAKPYGVPLPGNPSGTPAVTLAGKLRKLKLPTVNLGIKTMGGWRLLDLPETKDT